jgi:hypothetical protein
VALLASRRRAVALSARSSRTLRSVCGIVLVALGSTLASLAENCGTTSTQVGTVFIARRAGNSIP